MIAASRLILIAEDQPLASMALRAQLEALGHRVAAVARDGDAAAALARCLPAELGLFDLRMPGKSGLDAASEIFQLDPLPVLLLTGYGHSDLPHPVPQPPVFAVLTKPVGLAELDAAVRRATDVFDRWAASEGCLDRVHDSLRRRETIARALGEHGDDDALAVAASRLIQRARAEGRDLIELARELIGPER